MAPAVDENTGQVGGGGVAANDGVDVDALLEVRIDDCFSGRAPPRLRHLGESMFSTNSSDDVLF
jgi:hypothetical protein